MNPLDDYRAKFRTEKEALFEALAYCLEKKVAPPEWVREAFARGLQRWHEDKHVMEFGEAFGIPWKKADPTDPNNDVYIYNDVMKASASGRATDNELMEEIAEKYGCKKTKVWDLYREGRKFFGWARRYRTKK